jgi:hypothetical protein
MRSIPSLAVAWCLGYAALALSWSFGAPGFPFGANDPHGPEMGSWLSGATPGWTGALLAAACCAGAVAASAVARGVANRRLATAVLAPLAVVLLLVVPDVRVLQNLAYSFSLHFDLVDWPVLNQALCVVGGLLVAGTAIVVLRRPPCARCRRPEAVAGEKTRWTRVGRWAVIVAICSQLPYAVQRAAWNVGIPMGVSQRFVDDLAADVVEKGMHPMVLWMLVIPDVLGALLTLGLVMRWGERFPAWVPFLGGRRVPISLAVVPATVVSVAVTVAGLALYRFVWDDGGVKGTAVPGLLWLPWGLALATATFAYVMRRRRICAGHEPPARSSGLASAGVDRGGVPKG